MSWSDFARECYNNQYTKYAQIAVPAAARLALNVYTGQSLSTGMPIAAVLAAISYTQMPTFDDGFSNDDAMVDEENQLYGFVLNPIKHQLMSCLLNSVLSSFGFDKHVTEFAAKMCVTFIYSSRFRDVYESETLKATIIFDLSRLFLGCSGLYNAFDGGADSQCFMSFVSQVAMLAMVRKFSAEDDLDPSLADEDIFEMHFAEGVLIVTVLNALSYPASTWLIPMKGASPIVHYVKDLPEFFTSFVGANVSAFTESGISI